MIDSRAHLLNREQVQAISEWIDNHADEITTTLAQLMRIPSVIGREAEAQAFMRAQYEAAGLEIDCFEPSLQTLEEHPAFVDSGIPFADRCNVVATWRGKGNGRSLILNGHTDVVSPEPVSAWTHEPFGADILSSPMDDGNGVGGEGRGRMYGRGAQDMKSGLIANLFALLSAKGEGKPRPYVNEPLPVPMGMTAGLDTRFAALYGVPAFAWGPKGANLHGADEYVELDSVIEVARTLAIFAMQWCGVIDD